MKLDKKSKIFIIKRNIFIIKSKMTTLNIEVPDKFYSHIKNKNINSYFAKLIQEDMLLSEIKSSKSSWVKKLNSLSDLDD